MSLRVGVSKREITPGDLTGLNPMGHTFDAVHDPTFLRALVLESGDVRCALIAVDLIEVGDTKDIRARIESELGIGADRIIIAPSHSHNAPRIGLVPAGGKARVPSPESLVYTEFVYDVMVDALAAAISSQEPARFGWNRSHVDVDVNRDEYIDGRWTLGTNPTGPSDKTVTVLAFQDLDGRPLAVITNYGVHPTVTLGTVELGADLAGAAAAYVESQLEGAVALWTSGALGDQAPRIAMERSVDPSVGRAAAYPAAAAQGMLIGATALDAALRIDHYDADPRLDARAAVVDCPARRLDVPPGMEQADVDSVELTLACILVGAVALTGASGEVTTPVYRALQRASPLAATLIVSNANARIGYLTEAEAYALNTKEAGGNPIVEGYAEPAVVSGLVELIRACSAV